jgi:glycosyltransferase involved in cell wall biosynthesis
MLKIACIPAYNEEKHISDIIKKTSLYVDKVIVCDDGSTDKTLQYAEQEGAIVIKHEEQKGKGEALKSLFNYAKKIEAEIMITIDGDGQFLPEEIPKIMKPIISENFDVVIGYRFDDASEMPSYRKVGNKMFDKLTNLATDSSFRDTQGGFRAYSKKAIDSIKFKNKGFGADSEILINASKNGLKITEEKITVLYDTGGKTSTKNPISHSMDVTTSLIEIIAIRHPLKIMGIPGVILITVGIIFGIVTLSLFNDTRYFSIPFSLVSIGTLLVGTLLFTVSIILFAIGRIMENNG